MLEIKRQRRDLKQFIMNSMNTKDIIQQYLKNSRVLTNSYFYLEERYRIPYDIISRKKDVPYDYPELVICDSLKKSCEQIKIGNDENFLIYDVALGRFLSNMDLLIWGKRMNKWHIELYMRKWYAEAYFSNGDYLRAYREKLCVDEISKKRKIRKLHTDPNRAMRVLFQELFVMLHEISHFRLSRLSQEEYRQRIDEKRLQLINSETMISQIESGSIDSFIEDEIRSLEHSKDARLLGNYKETFRSEEYWNAYHDYLKEYYTQDKNIEEIICDEFAMFSLLDTFEPLISTSSLLHKISLAEAKEMMYMACYLALQNVFFLSRIDIFAKRKSHGSSWDTADYYSQFMTMPNVQRRKRCLIRAIIKKEKEENTDSQKNIGLYWSMLAKKLDSLYDDFEDVFQENYSFVNRKKVMKKGIPNISDDELRTLIANSLMEIMTW